MSWLAASLLAASCVAATAHDKPRMQARADLAQSVRPSEPECYCWANGQRFAHGEQACIKGGGMTRLALCDRVLNVMSWSFSSEPCPES